MKMETTPHFINVLIRVIDNFTYSEQFLNLIDKKGSNGNFGYSLTPFINKISRFANQEDNNTDLYESLIIISTYIKESIKTTLGDILYDLTYQAASYIKTVKLTRDNVIECFYRSLLDCKNKYKLKIGSKSFFDILYPVLKYLYSNKNRPTKELMYEIKMILNENFNKSLLLKSKVGRASYHGKRSIGMYDPGTVFIYLVLEGVIKIYGT
ncbi:DAK2 domain-containing protein [Mycoplasma bradburyae]|uniref:DAK2 domain-containing protein n=1 Tax=Mycoplasma bradburyae TaxID=2963128 RepID=A0ABT5GBJ3_9MOLU|nr:DAK2 domain-containing protein [Mycoplasma bradburyae]MDC4181861.1 DAK2 domain-containing protein [Mycoplasma bradburyae]UTS70160.1 DAK2 domain-containing protein [Mycoplasma bradburyae]